MSVQLKYALYKYIYIFLQLCKNLFIFIETRCVFRDLWMKKKKLKEKNIPVHHVYINRLFYHTFKIYTVV